MDAINGSKPRYELLDGLRGVAALLVIWYHFFEGFATSPTDQMMNHGYLAVDFFFVLFGFVIGYAYDGRWSRGAPLRCCMACMRGLVRGYNPYGVAGYEILRYACAPALVEAGQAVE